MSHSRNRAGIPWLLALALVVGGVLTCTVVMDAAALPQYLYVSTRGNDAWSGKLPAANAQSTDGPFATLTRARDAIREMKKSGRFQAPVVVMMLSGTYRQAAPLVLEGQDSGTAGKPIRYTTYPGDQPVVSGARRITGFKPYRGRILQVTLPEVAKGEWKFRELYFNGARQIRARWPNFDPAEPLYGGWAFIAAASPAESADAKRFQYQTSSVPPKRWAKPALAEVKIIPWYCWVDDLIPVASMDEARKTITLWRPVAPSFMSLLKGNRFYVENVLEELDQPGEWALDSDTGTLYFWPPANSIANGEVSAPVAETLFDLRGTGGAPVHDVFISGLTLTQTRSTWPEQRHENFHSPLLRGEAIRLEHAEDCGVEDNVIRDVGGDGVRLQAACARNRVMGNEISYTGGQGISLASDSIINTDTWKDAAGMSRVSALYPKSSNNVIADNHIHHTGTVKKNGGAIQLYAINSVDNVISHNVIHDTADKAMTMQDGYGRFLVEYNQMYNLALEISDTGAVMTNRWHLLPGDSELDGRIVIRNNSIRDVIGCGAYDHPREGSFALRTKADGKIWTPYYAWGIYFDNSGAHRDVIGNIVAGTVLGGVSMPVGDPQDNLFENNILANGIAHSADLRVGGEAGNANRFIRNILYNTSPAAALLNVNKYTKQSLGECDYNLYFQGVGQQPKILGAPTDSFREWQAMGFDLHSQIADPMFMNPQGGDFRLKPDSPAFQLGFRPIEEERIGLSKTGTAASRSYEAIRSGRTGSASGKR